MSERTNSTCCAANEPSLDCGDDSIIVTEAKEVDCVVIDPGNGDEHDAVVTFTGVEGDQWSIRVEVAPTPNQCRESLIRRAV